jgi:hypothetical protein
VSVGLGENYFDRHILFHTHIAKSAGTSILDALTEMLGPDDVMNRNQSADPDSAVSSLSLSRRRSLKLLSGHFWYGTQDRHFDRRPIYLAAVRDPIQRFISLFHFVLAFDTHPLYREFDTRGPDGSARWFFTEKPRFANEMSNSFGVPPGASPVDWVEHRYAIIVPTKRADSLIAKLYELLAPDTKPRLWRSNLAPRSGFTISAETADECRAAAARDVLLCRQIEERYDDWLHNLGGRLQAEPHK